MRRGGRESPSPDYHAAYRPSFPCPAANQAVELVRLKADVPANLHAGDRDLREVGVQIKAKPLHLGSN
jgi:hypothetical protein